MADEPAKPKTEKQLAKEAAAKEKAEKFRLKQEKLKQAGEAKSKQPEKAKPEKSKEKKEKQVIVYQGKTEPGDKKEVSGPLPDSYSPKFVEAAWYQWWVKSGFFKPEYNEPKDGGKQSQHFQQFQYQSVDQSDHFRFNLRR